MIVIRSGIGLRVMTTKLLATQHVVLFQSSDSYWNYAVDHFFSQTIIVSLVVITWRSLWNILNDVVVPNNFWLSNLITWFGGIVLGLVLIALESSASRLSKYLQQKHKGNKHNGGTQTSLHGSTICSPCALLHYTIEHM